MPESYDHWQSNSESLRPIGSYGKITVNPEPDASVTAKDFASLKKAGMVRKAAYFVCSISDDTGEERTYAGMPISKVVQKELGIGGAIPLLCNSHWACSAGRHRMAAIGSEWQLALGLLSCTAADGSEWQRVKLTRLFVLTDRLMVRR